MGITKPIILCVDDEMVVLESLVTQLTRLFGKRYQIERASGVDEAWEVIEEIVEDGEELRLIISDWLMPPHRGDEFLNDVHKRFPELKMIMLSGHADESAIERVKKLPTLLAFVSKPWSKEEISELVESVSAPAD